MKLFCTNIFLFFLLFGLFVKPVNSQTNYNSDSILHLLASSNDSAKVIILSDLCWEYKYSEPKEALSYGLQALSLAQELENYEYIARLNNYIGVVHRNIGAHDKAITYFFDALQIAEDHNIYLELAYAMNNIGDIHNREKQYTDALHYNTQAFEVFKRLGDKKGMAYCYTQAALIFTNLEQYQTALEKHFKALEIRVELNEVSSIASTYNRIGEIYQILGNEDEALVYFIRSLDLIKQSDNKMSLSYAYINLGRYFKQKGDLTEAIKYIKESLRLGQEINSPLRVESAAKLLSEIYEKQGYIEVAYEYYKLYKAMGDSVSQVKNLVKINQMEMQYEFRRQQKQQLQRQERELELHEAELRQQKIIRNFIIIIAALLLVLASMIMNRYFIKRKAHEDLLDKNKQIEGQKSELLTLYNQLQNVHQEVVQKTQQIAQSEVRYRLLFQRTPAGIIEYDENLNIIDVNEKFEEISNKPKTEIFTYNLKNITNQDIVKTFQTAIKNKEGFWEGFFHEQLISDARFLIIRTKPFDFLVDDKKRKGGVAILEDITERKNTEQQIQKYVNELKQLNVTKDKLFSIIAHDLRSPFNVLLHNAKYLNTKYNELSREQIVHMIDGINKSAREAFNLLENLLHWARTQTDRIELEPEPINVETLVESNLTLLKIIAQNKNISIYSRVHKNIQIFGDFNTLNTVLRNLISNAIKFSFPNKTITITTNIQGNYLEISVIDEGVGIPENVISKLFKLDSSYTSKGTMNEKGTGLGLILCKEFVERNGGVLSLESEVNKGSKFSFTVPLLKQNEISEEEVSETKNNVEIAKTSENLILDNNLILQLPDIIKQLQGNYKDEWNKIIKSNRLIDIQKFGANIEKFGAESSISLIQNYGKSIYDKAKNFDIEHLNTALSYYTTLIVQLEEFCGVNKNIEKNKT